MEDDSYGNDAASEFSPDPLTEVIQAGARVLLCTAVIGGTVPALDILPDEVFDKACFSADRQTGFRDMLKRPQIIICGAEAHVCVMQTAIDLHDAGYSVAIVEDAVGSRFAIDREVALRRMENTGLARVTAEMVIFEWLGRGDDPAFRDALSIIKGRG